MLNKVIFLTFIIAWSKASKVIVIFQEGMCDVRYSPASTFKIAISLMGYNEGLLINEKQPEYPFKENYVDWLDRWKQPHNPTMWIKNSCIWYSQILTQRLGATKFKDYVVKFNYGNQDISGDKGKNNGLTNSWLGSSLEISPKEQAVFLQKLVDDKLPISTKSHEMTKRILFIEILPNGWKMYGKTGASFLLSGDRTKKLNIMQGWFVGWVQKGDRKIIFVNYIVDDKKGDIFPSLRAKEDTKRRLIGIEF